MSSLTAKPKYYRDEQTIEPVDGFKACGNPGILAPEDEPVEIRKLQ